VVVCACVQSPGVRYNRGSVALPLQKKRHGMPSPALVLSRVVGVARVIARDRCVRVSRVVSCRVVSKNVHYNKAKVLVQVLCLVRGGDMARLDTRGRGTEPIIAFETVSHTRAANDARNG